MEGNDEIYILCKGRLDGKIVTLREKGSTGISEKHNDTIKTVPGQKVHQECRREYCHPNKIAQSLNNNEHGILSPHQNVLRSAEVAFSFSTCCLFCGIKIEQIQR